MTDIATSLLTRTDWHAAFCRGADPAALLGALRNRLAARRNDVAVIRLVSGPELQTRLAVLAAARAAEPDFEALLGAMPLFGVPFAVKGNIDIAGVDTTAACPAFAQAAECSAEVVRRLEAAGAAWIAKTNLDQFATSLVGTRSPYGQPECVMAPGRISGGSSSGSSVLVGRGDAVFALGTDTAGSGRVAGRLQPDRRPVADPRAHQHHRCATGLPQPRLRVDLRAHGRRRGRGAGPGRRRRRHRHLQPLPARPGRLGHAPASRGAGHAVLFR